jgi:rRNA-processing protein FCF1
MKVVLDTNFLMIPGKFHVDIFEELKKLLNFKYELFIFLGTIKELERIASGQTKDKATAVVAINLIKQKNLKTLENSLQIVDDMIIQEISKNPQEYIVCTQDKVLKQRVKAVKSKIITLKSQKYLSYEV